MTDRSKFHSESMIQREDGTMVRLDSLTPEERDAWHERAGKRIERALQDYINQHPEEYEQIIAAIIAAGGTLLSYDDGTQKTA